MNEIILKVQLKDLPNQSVSAYCRQLIQQGENPNTRLEAYRGDVLALFTNHIGKAAKLYVDTDKEGKPVFKLLEGRKKPAGALKLEDTTNVHPSDKTNADPRILHKD